MHASQPHVLAGARSPAWTMSVIQTVAGSLSRQGSTVVVVAAVEVELVKVVGS